MVSIDVDVLPGIYVGTSRKAEDGTVDLRERAKGEDDAVKVSDLVSAVRGKVS